MIFSKRYSLPLSNGDILPLEKSKIFSRFLLVLDSMGLLLSPSIITRVSDGNITWFCFSTFITVVASLPRISRLWFVDGDDDDDDDDDDDGDN